MDILASFWAVVLTVWAALIKYKIVDILIAVIAWFATVHVAKKAFALTRRDAEVKAYNHLFYRLYNAWTAFSLIRLSFSEDLLKDGLKSVHERIKTSEFYLETDEEQVQLGLEICIANYLPNALGLIASIDEVMAESFHTAVDEFSRYDPIMATRLARQGRGSYNSYRIFMSMLQEATPELKPVLSAQKSSLNEIFDALSESFRKAMIDIAGEISKERAKAAKDELDAAKEQLGKFNIPPDILEAYFKRLEDEWGKSETPNHPQVGHETA